MTAVSVWYIIIMACSSDLGIHFLSLLLFLVSGFIVHMDLVFEVILLATRIRYFMLCMYLVIYHL